MLPHAYAPTIIPMNMIEFNHPLVCVFKSKSHCADGNMNDMEITSISSLVLTKPQIANSKYCRKTITLNQSFTVKQFKNQNLHEIFRIRLIRWLVQNRL